MMTKRKGVVNKFQIRWQLIRTQAKKIKDVDLKVQFVIDFIIQYPSKENYARVKNWMVMSAMPYKEAQCKMIFTEGKQLLETIEYTMEDEANDFEMFTDQQLMLVYKDLNKRKYTFQFDKAPTTHVRFMESLKDYLKIIV
tara:strand:+ start:180 stop:599 length:420 start_codon:yes stop_codon:yes gene_type:complete